MKYMKYMRFMCVDQKALILNLNTIHQTIHVARYT